MTESAPTPPIAIVLARDLMFVGRINATARAAGAAIKTLRDPKLLKDESADQVIVDLELPGAIEAVAEWKRAAAGRSATGFVSHTNTDVIAHAREAGIDSVMARGRFVETLPDLLGRLAAKKN